MYVTVYLILSKLPKRNFDLFLKNKIPAVVSVLPDNPSKIVWKFVPWSFTDKVCYSTGNIMSTYLNHVNLQRNSLYGFYFVNTLFYSYSCQCLGFIIYLRKMHTEKQMLRFSIEYKLGYKLSGIRYLKLLIISYRRNELFCIFRNETTSATYSAF